MMRTTIKKSWNRNPQVEQRLWPHIKIKFDFQSFNPKRYLFDYQTQNDFDMYLTFIDWNYQSHFKLLKLIQLLIQFLFDLFHFYSVCDRKKSPLEFELTPRHPLRMIKTNWITFESNKPTPNRIPQFIHICELNTNFNRICPYTSKSTPLDSKTPLVEIDIDKAFDFQINLQIKFDSHINPYANWNTTVK